MSRCHSVVKVVFVLSLLGCFLYLMARPSIEKFVAGGIMVEVKIRLSILGFPGVSQL